MEVFNRIGVQSFKLITNIIVFWLFTSQMEVKSMTIWLGLSALHATVLSIVNASNTTDIRFLSYCSEGYQLDKMTFSLMFKVRIITVLGSLIIYTILYIYYVPKLVEFGFDYLFYYVFSIMIITVAAMGNTFINYLLGIDNTALYNKLVYFSSIFSLLMAFVIPYTSTAIGLLLALMISLNLGIFGFVIGVFYVRRLEFVPVQSDVNLKNYKKDLLKSGSTSLASGFGKNVMGVFVFGSMSGSSVDVYLLTTKFYGFLETIVSGTVSTYLGSWSRKLSRLNSSNNTLLVRISYINLIVLLVYIIFSIGLLIIGRSGTTAFGLNTLFLGRDILMLYLLFALLGKWIGQILLTANMLGKVFEHIHASIFIPLYLFFGFLCVKYFDITALMVCSIVAMVISTIVVVSVIRKNILKIPSRIDFVILSIILFSWLTLRLFV